MTRVMLAEHPVAADDFELTAARTRLADYTVGGADEDVAAECGDDLGFVRSGHARSRPERSAALLDCNAMPSRDLLVWIDLEMTGLSPDEDVIIEIATLLTDRDLEIVAEGPVIAIHHPDAVLDRMDAWNRRQHGGSGLLPRVRASGFDTAAAEAATLAFLSTHVEPGSSPICGNSICQDRRFLARHMPTLEKFFHYRSIDVSTLKELARRWAPDVLAGVTKSDAHLALEDIRDSVRELRYYRGALFAPAYRRSAGSPP